MKTIRIALAEDQSIVQQGLVRLINDYVEFQIVAIAKNGKELLNKLKVQEVDLVILDEEMPEMDGRQTLSLLNQFHPTIKVIFLTVQDSIQHLRRLILSGANTVVSKSEDFIVLIEAMKAVAQDRYYFHGKLTPEFLDSVLESPEMKCTILEGDSLTKRELEIIRLICDGRSNGEISLELSLSQRTIENHRQRIARKTGCKTTAELVVFAIRNGVYEI